MTAHNLLVSGIVALAAGAIAFGVLQSRALLLPDPSLHLWTTPLPLMSARERSAYEAAVKERADMVKIREIESDEHLIAACKFVVNIGNQAEREHYRNNHECDHIWAIYSPGMIKPPEGAGGIGKSPLNVKEP